MRTPVKEGLPSPIRTPGTGSPIHRSKPRKDQSPMRAEKPLSPEKPLPSPSKDGYEDDFEGTNENVSSLEEDRRREAREGKWPVQSHATRSYLDSGVPKCCPQYIKFIV